MNTETPRGATRLYLIRHGEPEERYKGRCYGRLDAGLSARGVAQAEEAARFLALAPLAAIYTSPRQRATESAAPLARLRGLAPVVREDLAELDFGRFDGMTYEDAQAQYPEVYRLWMEHPTQVVFPEGESYARLRRRVAVALREIRAAHRGASAAIVSHGGVNRVALAEALGLSDDGVFRFDQSYAGISVIDYFEETPVVRVLNGGPCGGAAW